ncbi:GH25 family lysozyme M1 (1,4-beta-N-acetylmuramidase) [Actinoplanes octamycinicus]|uniref:GH25 family lysozyme M1 (1,4-beta-N-acetylmuramidase) n=1 Tax=Actinoplanes octamycinicus TaxID=135948 RepID=A0A7W7MBB8_9ACTN|nr:GH25 family lysozyme [Actinoplanes octamycinicus]MBB4743821.1 GH25 family lysozyme M1 (1,4-beta-N-acetylmuramidase) [Actinoplanes octamycinicus]GIE58450.1 hypothetical protein Aoc01nite_38520 [Actinoplanes octamycinicus]
MSERNLLVDVYSGDLGGKPNWEALVDAPNVVGAILKATEGTTFHTSWFDDNWPAVHDLVPDRYGDTWLRGAYHFLKFDQDGAAQADFYLRTVEKAGGFDVGDIIPIVDVELGGENNSNRTATAAQIVECTTAFAERIREQANQQTMLYGNGAMRDKGITDRMGCDWLWVPRYTAQLPRNIYERAGWDLGSVAMWQYCGDGTGFLAGYPTRFDGFGAVDISVVLFDTLADFRNKVCGQVIEIE